MLKLSFAALLTVMLSGSPAVFAQGDPEVEEDDAADEKAAEVLTTITLARGWVSKGKRRPQWRRSGKLCVLSGLMASTEGATEQIATLPKACRPSSRGQFERPGGHIEVLRDGRVYYRGDVASRRGDDSLSFDDIQFMSQSAPVRRK